MISTDIKRFENVYFDILRFVRPQKLYGYLQESLLFEIFMITDMSPAYVNLLYTCVQGED